MSDGDVMQRLLAKGRERTKALITKNGGSFDLAEVANHLGISEDAVHRLVETKGLLEVPTDEGSRYPIFQFVDGHVHPVVVSALENAPSHWGGKGVMLFLLSQVHPPEDRRTHFQKIVDCKTDDSDIAQTMDTLYEQRAD